MYARLTISFSARQTLLVDGYISQTFQSRPAEQYILNLLKSTSVPPHTPSAFPTRDGSFFLLHSVPSHIPTQHSSPPGRWLVDRGVVNRGTVVPQRLFSAHTSFDRRQQVDLQLPIFFEGSDGRLGISLEASAAGQCYALREASYPTQLGEKTTTNIRIAVSVVLIFRRPCSVIDLAICSRSQWPGYKEFKRPIQARDETSAHNPINVALFAHQIGRTVDAFLQVCPTSLRGKRKTTWVY
jgi:hypothetical protein